VYSTQGLVAGRRAPDGFQTHHAWQRRTCHVQGHTHGHQVAASCGVAQHYHDCGLAGLRTLATPPTQGSFSRGLRLLLVDGCAASASTLSHYCGALSVDIWCDHLPTGEAAVERLSSCELPYDLVVTASELAGMSGYALCVWHKEWHRQKLAKQLGHAPSPTEFVCISAEPDHEACASFGIDHCFAKPLTASCFARLLLGWLDARASKIGATETTRARSRSNDSDDATNE